MAATVQIEAALESALVRLAEHCHVEIPLSAQEPLVRYIRLLAKWNRVYNLTAISDPVAMVHRHLMDSLVLCRWLPSEKTEMEDIYDVLDVGSGAGLPCLPLAIVRPDLAFVSVESNGKKTRFQQQVVMELSLDNVRVCHQRIEQTAAQANIVTSRAFTAPTDFLPIAATVCAPSGKIIIMLTHTDKLPTPLPTGYELQELVAVDIPGDRMPRHIAVCRQCL